MHGAVPGTATQYALNGDVRIAYEDLGGAGGDPLLLVMGLGASRCWWPRGFTTALRVPAQVLHGEDDQVLRPAAARRTAAAIDGARLRIFPGLGHYLPRELWPVVPGEIRTLADQATQPPAQPIATSL